MSESAIVQRVRLSPETGSLLLEYVLKALLVAGLCELVFYRLISRLGMHLSKVAQEYVAVEYFLRGASSIGFALMNFSAILVFLVLFALLFYKVRGLLARPWDHAVVALGSLLLALTVVFLLFPPGMPGAIAYNVLTFALVWTLVAQYCRVNPAPTARAMALCYGGGVSGWLYYQISTTTYGWVGAASSPPLVHEISRLGEALMVAATALVFAVYSGFTVRSKNRQRRRRALQFIATWAALFIGLLVMDAVIGLFDPAMAKHIRQASQGIGWIFQMGMGYTFYLPFALYVAGLLFWSYAVIKQISMGRRAGYGLALMFIAGYALQLSHLTLFVVVGLLLIVNDGRIDAREAVGPLFPVEMPDRPAAEAPGLS
jgi:hypothetical protein